MYYLMLIYLVSHSFNAVWEMKCTHVKCLLYALILRAWMCTCTKEEKKKERNVMMCTRLPLKCNPSCYETNAGTVYWSKKKKQKPFLNAGLLRPNAQISISVHDTAPIHPRV